MDAVRKLKTWLMLVASSNGFSNNTFYFPAVTFYITYDWVVYLNVFKLKEMSIIFFIFFYL